MLDPHPDLTRSVVLGLGWIYLILFGMNAWWTYLAARSHREVQMPELLGGQKVPVSGFWALYSAVLLMVSLAHFATGTGTGTPSSFLIRLPDGFKHLVDQVFADPVSYF